MTTATAEFVPRASIKPGDRLGLTLFLAVAVHAIVILGVSFSVSQSTPQDLTQTMEITLVPSKSNKLPDNAQLLAQANQQGKGRTKENKPFSAPRKQAIPTPHKSTGTAPENTLPQQARQQPPTATKRELLTAKQSTKSIATQPKQVQKQKPTLTASQLISRSLQIASASAEVEQFRLNNQNKQRSKFITASTREYKFTAYLDGWRRKVEEIGLLNYPEEARRRKIIGNLIMTVALRPDGTIYQVTIDKSSGNKVLDDAAKRIVRLAAPFSPFPENIRKDTDLLHITRTWVFGRGNRFSTR